MILPLVLFAAQVFAAQAVDPSAPSIEQCGTCHAREAESVSASPMTRAMQLPANAPILGDNPDLSIRIGKFLYSVRTDNDKTIYSVTDGVNTLSALIGWAFGKGVIGQTWLLEKDGILYEGAVSYYSGSKALDLTPGHEVLRRNTLEEAFGRKVDAAEAKRCFGCHSTDVVWKGEVHPDSLTPGVQCWQCHAGAQGHASELIAGRAGLAAHLADLRTVTNEDLAAVCNRCHLGWSDVAANGPRGVTNVRMQFYRLANSPCYDSEDRRISCTACHDVHGNLSTDAASYDLRCQACHSQVKDAAQNSDRNTNRNTNRTAKSCPVSTKDCISCHMPKIEIPGMHHQFTDHEIRIVRKGEAYPD